MADYTDFVSHKPFEKPGSKPKSSEKRDNPGQWWLEGEYDAAGCLVSSGESLVREQSYRHQQNIRHARLYGNNDIGTFNASSYARSTTRFGNDTQVAFNVIASATDTLTSKIAKSRPQPSFQTFGGSWDMQRKAKQLRKFIQGVFYEGKVYQEAKRQFRFACIFGTGLIHVYLDAKGRVAYENAFIDELFVDDADGKYGNPRQLLRRKLVHKNALMERFKDKLDAADIERISSAKPPPDVLEGATDRHADMVEVWEGWHLPSGPDAKDGRHVIACGEVTLCDEAWEFSFFPFAIFRYTPRVLGFWGQGLGERLFGKQLAINRTANSIDQMIRRRGKGRTFVQRGSKIVEENLTNDFGDIVEYTGVPPTVDSSNAVAQEDWQYLQYLIDSAFQQEGISMLSAAAKKPSGLDAAVALREYNDIESERFAELSQAWDQNFLDLAEITIELVRSAGGKGYKVQLPNKRFTIEIDWSDIDLKRDQFTMQMFPSSSLPNTPAARYQKVKEMQLDGFLSMPEARRLLDFPDLDAEEQLGNAAIDSAEYVIGQILDEATPKLVPIEPYMDLETLVSRGTAHLLYAECHGCEKSRLDLLRQMIDEATSKLQQITEEAQARSAAQAPAPPSPTDLPPPGAPQAEAPMQPPAQPPAV